MVTSMALASQLLQPFVMSDPRPTSTVFPQGPGGWAMGPCGVRMEVLLHFAVAVGEDRLP